MAEAMYDPEVVAELRRQFEAADKDGSGEIDATEACEAFARSCGGGSEEEVRKTAERLRCQVDTDRSGTISFEEYCFRFGRRLQMEQNRKRRAAASGAGVSESERLKQEREELEKEREAVRRERERLMLEREREALRREREDLERQRGAPSRQLQVGSWVRIQGLQGAPQLNGLEAKVQSYDEGSMRYVVELRDGSNKKIKEANLVAFTAESKSWLQKLNAMTESACGGLQRGCAKAQVWIAESGYEWWQILIGLAVLVLVVVSWLQASRRHSGPSSGRSSRAPREETYSYGSDYYEDPGPSYSNWDDDSWSFDFGGMQKYLLLGGLAVLCWKGIIPVHRMDWFQLYMLWNMLQSTGILGGGRGYGRGYGRRRGFF